MQHVVDPLPRDAVPCASLSSRRLWAAPGLATRLKAATQRGNQLPRARPARGIVAQMFPVKSPHPAVCHPVRPCFSVDCW